jgi:hypothetical protein
MFLLELGVPGLGSDIDWAAGISLFCRMAIGGMFFAILLIGLLHALKWRLNREENVCNVYRIWYQTKSVNLPCL